MHYHAERGNEFGGFRDNLSAWERVMDCPKHPSTPLRVNGDRIINRDVNF